MTTAPPQARPRTLTRVRRSLTRGEWTAIGAMATVVVLLHVAGWVTLGFIVAPRHYAVGSSGVFGLGLGLTAYTLGMRHAFDADHIAAIDNTTRKLLAEGKRPVTVGFWFSLGHSTIVFVLCLLLAFGVRSLAGQLENDGSTLQNVTGVVGTLVSGSFLYLLGILNLVILVGIVKVFRDMRKGLYDEATLEQHLDKRGLMNRFLGGLTQVGPQAVADLPDRAAVRARLRHRHRGRPAGAGRRRGRVPAALVRHPHAAGAVRRRDEPARHRSTACS